MTKEHREELKRIAEALISDKWNLHPTGMLRETMCDVSPILQSHNHTPYIDRKSAEFIVAFQPAMALELLAELERAEQELAEVRKDLHHETVDNAIGAQRFKDQITVELTAERELSRGLMEALEHICRPPMKPCCREAWQSDDDNAHTNHLFDVADKALRAANGEKS